MRVTFLEVAELELDEAVAYYHAESSGLGDIFLSEVISTIERIRRHPKAWQSLGIQLRRCRTRRFPYGLIYHVGEDEILIVAVANLHREPTYWRDRLAPQ